MRGLKLSRIYTNTSATNNPSLQTSSRPRDIGGSFASRRHGPQLSISDTNHHVTEAIGDMYGDDDYSKRDSRPLSYLHSPANESMVEDEKSYFNASNTTPRARPTGIVNGSPGKRSQTSPGMMQSSKNGSFENNGPLSPALSLRDQNTETANKQFPLNDIDYESNPAAVAQELSNLQALRRMSMDVGNTSDPDLPSFQGVSLMPSVAPTGDDNEDDPSRLFWVPARVHPELAPMEFKTFLENRVQSIKRRSGDAISLSPNGSDESSSPGSLRRKKSMLSRQIDNSGGHGAVGYKDGAEHLERKKSLSTTPELRIADLQELDALVRDPTKAMQKLTLDTGSPNTPTDEDMPILPQAPGIGLRRSTRTTYRRGSLRKGERVPFSKRAGSIRTDDVEDSPIASPMDGRPQVGYPLTKVQSEPPMATENFSRPNRGARRMQPLQQIEPITQSSGSMLDEVLGNSHASPSKPLSYELQSPQTPQIGSLPARSSSFSKIDAPVPRIIETPPPPEEPSEPPQHRQAQLYPERKSSQTAPSLHQQNQVVPEPPARSSKRPVLAPVIPPAAPKNTTLNDMAQHPSLLPGSSARTDALTFIPTLEERKAEKKSKKDDSDSGSRKAGWGWFKGSDEKEKNKKKDDDHKKGRSKVIPEKSHDIARLDVLQSTMETAVARGRESLLLDRDSIDSKLLEERKKEGTRKSSGESKKEKDGIFSSLFGGGKKKADKDSGSKKGSSLRTLSPDPPHRDLKPDIDYNWTRFSILEERAIYRMAHIKLANPRRALYSQVLLSNFMYSYLAKVQQMHPQMQIPQSVPQKKAAEAERRQKEQEQQYKEQQEHQRSQDGGEQYRYDYHQVCYVNHLCSSGHLLNVIRGLLSTQNPKRKRASTMLMILKYMITTMERIMGKTLIDHNPGPPNIITRMGITIRPINTAGRVAIITHMSNPDHMIMKKRMMMTICGNRSFLPIFPSF